MAKLILAVAALVCAMQLIDAWVIPPVNTHLEPPKPDDPPKFKETQTRVARSHNIHDEEHEDEHDDYEHGHHELHETDDYAHASHDKHYGHEHDEGYNHDDDDDHHGYEHDKHHGDYHHDSDEDDHEHHGHDDHDHGRFELNHHEVDFGQYAQAHGKKHTNVNQQLVKENVKSYQSGYETEKVAVNNQQDAFAEGAINLGQHKHIHDGNVFFEH